MARNHCVVFRQFIKYTRTGLYVLIRNFSHDAMVSASTARVIFRDFHVITICYPYFVIHVNSVLTKQILDDSDCFQQMMLLVVQMDLSRDPKRTPSC